MCLVVQNTEIYMHIKHPCFHAEMPHQGNSWEHPLASWRGFQHLGSPHGPWILPSRRPVCVGRQGFVDMKKPTEWLGCMNLWSRCGLGVPHPMWLFPHISQGAPWRIVVGNTVMEMGWRQDANLRHGLPGFLGLLGFASPPELVLLTREPAFERPQEHQDALCGASAGRGWPSAGQAGSEVLYKASAASVAIEANIGAQHTRLMPRYRSGSLPERLATCCFYLLFLLAVATSLPGCVAVLQPGPEETIAT